MDRYKVVDGSESAHCCFVATVVDITRPVMIGGRHYKGQFGTVCECFDEDIAVTIAAALNATQVATPHERWQAGSRPEFEKIMVTVGLIIDDQGTEAAYEGYRHQVAEFSRKGVCWLNTHVIKFAPVPDELKCHGLRLVTPDGFVYMLPESTVLVLRKGEMACAPTASVQFGANDKPSSRAHLASDQCWCEPRLEYVDSDKSRKVWVHRGTQ